MYVCKKIINAIIIYKYITHKDYLTKISKKEMNKS